MAFGVTAGVVTVGVAGVITMFEISMFLFATADEEERKQNDRWVRTPFRNFLTCFPTPRANTRTRTGH